MYFIIQLYILRWWGLGLGIFICNKLQVQIEYIADYVYTIIVRYNGNGLCTTVCS